MGYTAAVLSRFKSKGRLHFLNRLKARIFGLVAPTDKISSHKVYRAWNTLSAVNEVVSRMNPSVTICNQVGDFIAVARAFQDAGVPTFVYFRDAMWVPKNDELEELRKLPIIANSNYMADHLLREFGLQATSIPPLILPDRCRTTQRGDHVTIIGVNPKKGVHLAIEMARRLPDIPFLFIRSWDGADPAILSEISSLPNATYMEPVSDMRKIYGQTRILLAPSTWIEAWGRVVIEAQLNGIPVIASNHGGLPESVSYGGINLPIDADLGEWAQTVKDIYCDEERYRALSEKALQRTQEADVAPTRLVNKLIETCFTAPPNG